jgi:hypothetical protein
MIYHFLKTNIVFTHSELGVDRAGFEPCWVQAAKSWNLGKLRNQGFVNFGFVFSVRLLTVASMLLNLV